LVVRNGKGRTRKVTVGAGTIPVSAPHVNDRRTDPDGERRRFTSRILPPYMRRSPKVAEVLPVLYLRGLSTGDFREALVYNLANFLRTLALPGEIAQWSLTSLREKVVKIGATVIAHGRYAIFQMAEVAVPQELFGRLLDQIARLRPPDPAPC
jgi:DDE family transposase